MATNEAPAKKSSSPVATKTIPAFAKLAAVSQQMTKAELVRLVAEKLELTTKQTAAFFDLPASTTIQETKKNGEFTIPCLGKLVRA